MDAHSLRVLEYAAVRDRVVALASCTLGQERAVTMAPSTDPRQVRQWLTETTEADRLLSSPGAPPRGGIHDIRPALRAAAAEGVLEPPVLLAVADTAGAG